MGLQRKATRRTARLADISQENLRYQYREVRQGRSAHETTCKALLSTKTLTIKSIDWHHQRAVRRSSPWPQSLKTRRSRYLHTHVCNQSAGSAIVPARSVRVARERLRPSRSPLSPRLTRQSSPATPASRLPALWRIAARWQFNRRALRRGIAPCWRGLACRRPRDFACAVHYETVPPPRWQGWVPGRVERAS